MYLPSEIIEHSKTLDAALRESLAGFADEDLATAEREGMTLVTETRVGTVTLTSTPTDSLPFNVKYSAHGQPFSFSATRGAMAAFLVGAYQCVLEL